MAGEATPAQIAGFVVALRAKGETVDEIAGLVRGDATRTPTPIDVAGPDASTSSAPAATGANTVNISTMAAIVVAGAGRPGRQARQPGGLVRVAARPTCSRRSASTSTCRPTRVAERRRGGRASPSASPQASTRRCGTPPSPARELGIADGLQLPRPADQPGPGHARQAVGVRRRRGWRRSMAGRARRARRLRPGVPRRRRPRRADHHHHLPGLGRPGRRGHRGAVRPARRRPRPVPVRGPARRRRGVQRGGRPHGCWPARRARCATPCCSTRRRRWWRSTGLRGRWPSSSRAGMDGRRSRSTRARPRTLERWVAASNALAARSVHAAGAVQNPDCALRHRSIVWQDAVPGHE